MQKAPMNLGEDLNSSGLFVHIFYRYRIISKPPLMFLYYSW